MFTGLITDIGEVTAMHSGGDLSLKIACAYDPASIEIGASI